MPVVRQLSVADAPVCEVSGALDVTTAADLRADLTAILAGASSSDLVLDLAGVEQVDMVGLGLLVGVHRQAQRGGRRLVLIHVPPRVMRLLVATRLHRVLSIRDVVSTSVGEAVLRIPETVVRAG